MMRKIERLQGLTSVELEHVLAVCWDVAGDAVSVLAEMDEQERVCASEYSPADWAEARRRFKIANEDVLIVERLLGIN